MAVRDRKGKAVDVKQVARELGVRYVLEGSVRKGGNRVPITDQLIDTATGAHIWAGRFDGALDDVCELQDQVSIERRQCDRPEAAPIGDRAHQPQPDRPLRRQQTLDRQIAYPLYNANSETMLACVKSRLSGRRSRVATLS